MKSSWPGFLHKSDLFVWIGENETRPKTSKNKWLGHYFFILMAKYFLLAMSATALQLFCLFSSYDEKKFLKIASKYTSVGLGQRLIFLSAVGDDA